MTGHFEGNGRRISNLFIRRPTFDNVGLIGLVDSAAGDSVSIRNVQIDGALTSVTGRNSVGLLIGQAIVSGSMLIESNSVAGMVRAEGFDVGGMVGTIVTTGGALTVRNNSASATASGVGRGAGGLIGFIFDGGSQPASATLSGNDASGSVTGETAGGLVGGTGGTAPVSFEDESSTAIVDGRLWSGGLIGSLGSNTAAVHRSRATGSVVATGYAGGLIGFIDSLQAMVSESSSTTSSVRGSSVGGLIGVVSFKDNASITVQYSYAEVAATGMADSANAGGLVGTVGVGQKADGASFRLNGAYASGAVEGQAAGGLIGTAQAFWTNQIEIENVFALGTTTGSQFSGGLFGNAHADDEGLLSIQNGYSIGAVNGTGVFRGGLAGQAAADPSSSASLTVANAYWSTDASGSNNPFGVTSASSTYTEIHGATLQELSCPTGANDTSCSSNELYNDWETAMNANNEPLWRFSSPGRLPALRFSGVIHQPMQATGGGFTVVRE